MEGYRLLITKNCLLKFFNNRFRLAKKAIFLTQPPKVLFRMVNSSFGYSDKKKQKNLLIVRTSDTFLKGNPYRNGEKSG